MSTEQEFHAASVGSKTINAAILALTAEAVEAEDRAELAWSKVGAAWFNAGFNKSYWSTLSKELENEWKESTVTQLFSLELRQLMALAPAAVAEEQRQQRLNAMKKKSNIWNKIKSSCFRVEELQEGVKVAGGTKPLPPPTKPATATVPTTTPVTQIPPASTTPKAQGGKVAGAKQPQDSTGEAANGLPMAFQELKSAVGEYLEAVKRAPTQPALVYSVGSLFTLALNDLTKTLPSEQGRSKAASEAAKMMRRLWVDLETQFK